ncbi:MAG: GTPase ObgE, partial [Gemmatimonadetes bacterium]|nr:GTPase ObgE [Gemmatimonadota bacterium]
NQRARSLAQAAERLGVDSEQLLPFSSKSGEGRDELLGAIEDLLTAEPDP